MEMIRILCANKEAALENAKINALEEQAVENIILMTNRLQDISGVYNDFYILQFQQNKAIKSYELIDMSTSIGDFKNVKIDVEINALVIKYKNSTSQVSGKS